jgi:hypothetical protein
MIPLRHGTRTVFWSAPVWQQLSDAAALSSLPQGPAGEPGTVVPLHVAAFRVGRNVGYAERLSRPIQDDDGERALASPVLRQVGLDA